VQPTLPGADRVSRMLATGTHVLIRVKSDIALPRTGGFLPDGSYCSYLAGGPAGGRWCLKVRVVEYLVDVDGQDTGEMFCLVTDLHDHVAYPADQLAAAYAWRWPGPETSLKEAKSAITGAGPSSGPIFRSKSPDLVDQEHAAWVCGTGLCRALARSAARRAAPGRKSSPARSRSPPRAAPPWPAPGPVPRPRACPPRSPGPCTATPSAAWAGTGSSSTATGTATEKPRPARHSPPPGVPSPPAPRPRTSPSACQQRPDRHRPRSPPLIPPRNPPDTDPVACRSASRTAPMPVTLRNRNTRRSGSARNAVTNTNHAEVHGIGIGPQGGMIAAPPVRISSPGICQPR